MVLYLKVGEQMPLPEDFEWLSIKLLSFAGGKPTLLICFNRYIEIGGVVHCQLIGPEFAAIPHTIEPSRLVLTLSGLSYPQLGFHPGSSQQTGENNLLVKIEFGSPEVEGAFEAEAFPSCNPRCTIDAFGSKDLHTALRVQIHHVSRDGASVGYHIDEPVPLIGLA